jgi:hypothetical protein
MKSHSQIFLAASAAFLFAAASALAQGTVTSVGTGGGLTGGPITTSGTVSLDPKIYNPVTAPPYNAVCNGSTDDSAALQAAINAIPAQGGVINLPSNGSTCAHASTLDFRGKNDVQFIGGGLEGTSTQVSNLLYTGSGARAYDLRDTAGTHFKGIFFGWSNPGFNGIVVDAGSANPGTNVSFYFNISESQFGPVGSGSTGTTCVNVSEAIEFTIDHVSFNACYIAIHGQNVLGQSTTGLIQHNQFYLTGGLPILECGESWTLIANIFEPLNSGRAGAFQNTVSLPCKNMVSIGNWYGDVTVSGGSWFNQLSAIGFTAIGDVMGANNSGANLGYNVIGGSGYKWEGGSYSGMSIGFGCASAQPTGMRWETNTFTNIATVLSSSANCLNASADNNTPNLAVPLATWTPTYTASSGSIPVTASSAVYKQNGNSTEYWLSASFGTVTGTGSLAIAGLPIAPAAPCSVSGNDETWSETFSGYIGTGGTGFILFRASNPAAQPAVRTGSIIALYASCPTN